MVSLLSALYSCPDPNRHTLLYLLQHLQRLDRNPQRHLNASQPWILHGPNCVLSSSRVSEKELVNKMSPMNLATVFGPSLLRPPVVGLGHVGPAVDISQEVVVQVSSCGHFLIMPSNCVAVSNTFILL